MIIHDHKLIFIHIPKNGGRSISSLFNQRFDHFTANYYATEYRKFWESYTKFTILRNPYDRYVSMYHYIQTHRRHKYEPIACEGADFKQWLIKNMFAYRWETNFYSPELHRGEDGELGSRFWFSPQYMRIELANGDVKPTIHYLENGMDMLESYLFNVTGKKFTIPHTNKTEHKPFQEYYDSELIKLVNDFPPLKWDLTMFNYERL